MGETLPLFTTSFNRAVQVESRPEHLTGDAGAVIQRELMERPSPPYSPPLRYEAPQ